MSMETRIADNVLIQLTGDHELSGLENEVEEIRKRTSIDFRFIAAKVDDWNYELSPWKAPAVFGNEDFGDGAAQDTGADSDTMHR